MAANSGRLGKQIVYLTNSAGGLRAAMTTSKSTKNNIAGIVTYESIGYVFPLTILDSRRCRCRRPSNCADGLRLRPRPHVPLEDFKKLAKLKKIQFVWGDNQPETEVQVIHSRDRAPR